MFSLGDRVGFSKEGIFIRKSNECHRSQLDDGVGSSVSKQTQQHVHKS